MRGEGVEVGVHMKIVVIQYLRHATRGRGGPACFRVCVIGRGIDGVRVCVRQWLLDALCRTYLAATWTELH